MLEAGIEKVAWGGLLEVGGYTEGGGDGLGGEEVDGGEVGEGEEGGGEGCDEGGHGDAAPGALEGYGLGSVGEDEYGGYCITGGADEFFGEADVPIEECGPHVLRLAEVLCKMRRLVRRREQCGWSAVPFRA